MLITPKVIMLFRPAFRRSPLLGPAPGPLNIYVYVYLYIYIYVCVDIYLYTMSSHLAPFV